MKGLRLFQEYCLLNTDLVRIDLIYEGIATIQSNHQKQYNPQVRIDLIYEGIAT